LALAVSTSPPFHDHSGKPLEGGNNYRLHVPAKVPVSQFWSIHHLQSGNVGLLPECTKPHSRFAGQRLEEERRRLGGPLLWPEAAMGQDSNWIYTQAGKKWFPWFRVYGPEKAIFDKSFKLPDIERAK